MPNNHPSAHSWHASFALFVLLLGYILSFIDRNVMAVLIGPIRQDFAISDTQFGLLHGLAFSLIYTVLGLPIARAADSKSRRTIVAIGIFFWSVMTCWCGLVKSFAGLFIARMGVGVGEAALSPPAHSMLTDFFSPKRLPVALAVFSLGVPIGAGMAYMIGGWVYGYFASADPVVLPLFGTMTTWQMTFIAVGLPGFLVGVLMLLVREPPRRGKLALPSGHAAGALPLGEVMGYIWQRRGLYGAIFGSISALSIFGYAIMSWYLESMIRSFGVERSVVGPQFGQMFIVAGVAGALCGGWLTSWMLQRGYQDANMRIIVIVTLAWLVPGTLAPLAPTRELALWGVFPSLFLLNSYVGVAIAGLQLVTPNQMRAQASAVLLFMTNLLGLGLGPVIVGFFTDYLFGNDQYLRYSLSLLGVITCPVAAIWAGFGLRHFRAAVREAESRA